MIYLFVAYVLILPTAVIASFNLGRDAGIKDGKLEALMHDVGKMKGDGR